jgi:hypothetical protein
MLKRMMKPFLVSFVLFMVLNQTMFGNCYALYCLVEALPGVLVMALIAAAAFASVVPEDKDKENQDVQ